MRLLAPIGVVGGFFAVMMFLYYLQTLPGNALIMLRSHLLPRYADGMIAVFVVTTLYLLIGWARPQLVKPPLAIALFLLLATIGVWPEERMRESMRKPYVVGQYIYGNQVISRDAPGKGVVGEVDAIAEKGLLALHPFIPDRLRSVTADNRLEVGELLTKIACSNCHSLEPGAPLRSLPDKFHGSGDKDLIAAFLNGPLKHGAIPYMPRIDLPPDETDAIASYLAAAGDARRAEPDHRGVAVRLQGELNDDHRLHNERHARSRRRAGRARIVRGSLRRHMGLAHRLRSADPRRLRARGRRLSASRKRAALGAAFGGDDRRRQDRRLLADRARRRASAVHAGHL